MITDEKLTLVLYPNTHGIAFVLCENPKEIVDFGLKTVSRKEQKRWITKIKEMIEFAQPDIVIIMNRNGSKNEVSKRIRFILNEVEILARKSNINLVKYTSKQLNYVFSEFKAVTKYERARLIAKWYTQLKSKMPYQRKEWLAEHYQMGLFDAFSLMLCHYYFKE